MQMTRRQLGKMGLMALGMLTLSSVSVLTGCPGSDVVIAAIVAAAQIATAAAAILRPVNPSTADLLTTVATDLGVIQKLYNQFETAVDAGSKVTIAGEIQAALGTLTNNLAAILSAVKIANPALVVYITVGIAVVNSAISIIIAHLPAAQAAVAHAARAARPALPEVPGAKTAKDLKKAWKDASIVAGHPEAVVK